MLTIFNGNCRIVNHNSRRAMRLVLLMLILLMSNANALTLKGLLRLVDNHNLDIAIKRHQVKQGIYLKKSIISSFFPSISLTGQAEEYYPSYGAFSKKSWNQDYRYGISVSDNLFNLQRQDKLKSQSFLNLSQYGKFDQERLTQYYKAISLFLELKADKKLISYREKEMDDAKTILDVSSEKYKKGLVLVTDVLKAKANLEEAKANLEEARKNYNVNFNNLNELLNFSLSKNETIDIKLRKNLRITNERKLVNEALKLRPEIRVENFLVKSAKADIQQEKSNLRPSLTLSASYYKQSSHFPINNNNYNISASLNFPVFDSGVTHYHVLSQDESLNGEVLRLRKVKNGVKTEVLNAISSFNASQQELRFSSSFLSYSNRAYKRTFNEYKLGVCDITSLLQSFDNLCKAMEDFTNKLYAYNLRYYGVLKASGRLLLEDK